MIDMSVLYFVAPLRKKSRIGLAQQLPRLRTAKSSQELSSFKANCGIMAGFPTYPAINICIRFKL